MTTETDKPAAAETTPGWHLANPFTMALVVQLLRAVRERLAQEETKQAAQHETDEQKPP